MSAHKAGYFSRGVSHQRLPLTAVTLPVELAGLSAIDAREVRRVNTGLRSRRCDRVRWRWESLMRGSPNSLHLSLTKHLPVDDFGPGELRRLVAWLHEIHEVLGS